MIGNKLDKEGLRQVSSEDARKWCRENGDIPYFETSALENIAVDTAFVEMAKSALKRESQNQLFSLPDTIGGAGGAIKLNQFAASGSAGEKGGASGKKKKKSGCC